jgi:hypothetical protein
MSEAWPWLVLILLGAYHGINPAMGWLFAVALGLQERSRRAVYSALLPLALGHELSIAAVVLVVGVLQLVADPAALRIAGAIALIGFGIYKFVRPRSHPKWVGMRVTAPELVLWSFLMSTAHGAGLMIVPVLLRLPTNHDGHNHVHSVTGAGVTTVLQDLAAVLVHSGAMLVVMGAVAVVVYEKVGVAILRRAWLNLDVIWAAAAVIAGVATLFT